ncbi:hypothetical protein D4R71_01375 [bacterium]|nr:MAG: hypothetical protein D4R71_01375 [bacterium]
MTIYPLLPYIRKFVQKSNEKGMLNLALEIMNKATLSQKLSIMLEGGKSILKKDISQMIKLAIDVESLTFKGLNIGAIFLHDALTDLALGLDLISPLETFRNHIEKKIGVSAGFITKNVHNFRNKVDAKGWNDYLVMASVNASGFFVNPSLEVALKAIESPGMNFIAMSTLAGGALNPEMAYQFLGEKKNIKSVVVGMSKKEHILETVNMINKFIN